VKRFGAPALATLALALGSAACGDDDDSGPAEDAGAEDAGPWSSGTLTCASDVLSDYATRTYTFSDPFSRQDLGPNWHTATGAAWALEDDTRLVVSEAGDGPGPLAMVSDGQNGAEIVVWLNVDRDAGWAGAPSVVCRADGPPMTQGYGVRLLGDTMELFEQDGAGLAAAVSSAPLSPAIAEDATVRVVLGCTGETVTAFVYALDDAGVVGGALGCASWRSGDAARTGAVALTQSEGRTAFDEVRMVLDP